MPEGRGLYPKMPVLQQLVVFLARPHACCAARPRSARGLTVQVSRAR